MCIWLGMGKDDEQDEIFKNQVSIIRQLADKQSCIVVGRCSDYILREREDCMHVFIYASYEHRMKNCGKQSMRQVRSEKENVLRNCRKKCRRISGSRNSCGQRQIWNIGINCIWNMIYRKKSMH